MKRAVRLTRGGAARASSSLLDYAHAIRRAELARFEHRLRNLTPAERRAVETTTAAIVDGLLQLPTVRLREAAVTPEGAWLARTVHDLFDLG